MPAPEPSPQPPSPVRYRVSMPHPHRHLFEVDAEFPPVQAASHLTVGLPVWTPGSYLVREYARHVQELRVLDEAGRSLPFQRLDKRSLRVESGGGPVRLRYKVYANELTVRTSHLDGSHGYFNGATLFYFSEALRDRPHEVTVQAPEGWRTTTALDARDGAFLAADYDELVDSPFEVSPHEPLEFEAAGVPHQIVTWGDVQLDEARLVTELKRLCEVEAALFGGLPTKRYVFFLYGTDRGRGGLEHKASTALLYPRSGFANPKGWEDFLALAAHEYFHLWNVKRIKPRRLVPFDYTQENYTELLWFFEGGTSYYDTLFVRRAGLMPVARYLMRLGEALTSLHGTPGRRVMPLVDASFLSWVKHYRPDENSPNSQVSYYLKGEIVCLLLDLHLRRASGDRRSLDDVLRLLWQRYGDESGVSEDGIEAAILEIGGPGLRPFLDEALRTTNELDLEVFSHVGLEVRLRTRESASDKGGTPPRLRGERTHGYLGIVPRGATFVGSVLEDSPAMHGGLYADDEIVALDGFKCDAGGLVARIDERRPGEVVRVTVFRREKLLDVAVTVGTKPADVAWLARVEKPTEAQKAAFAAWTGAAWEELEAKGSSGGAGAAS